jgi:enoyl-CoA hydratase/carnithine racemase
MSYTQILTEQHDDVLLITLNRPEKLNAWTRTMNNELCSAIEAANDDPSTGAVVLTGAGRGFCAGADIGESFGSVLEAEDVGCEREDDSGDRDWVSFVRSSKPIVVAINGVAVGVGITMVLPMDVLLASDRARIGMFFVRMGLVPELASSQFLVQRVGFALASEMCLSGRLYEAGELEGKGLVNRVVAHDQLLDEALATAHTIAANPSPSLLMIKDLLTQNGACDDLEAVGKREQDALEKAYATPAHREAVSAFMEKRQPKFR